ncbi:MAG: DUF3352 domain-containing protein [Chloroflexi bacterium]|nr:MAG: DUF3352 domain-containing protein [Chloroflexota bacterium]
MSELSTAPSGRNRGRATKVILLAVGALLLALIACGGIAFIMRDQLATLLPFLQQGAESRAADIIPPDTFLFATFNPNLQQADNFDLVKQAWGDLPEVEDKLENWPAALFEDSDFDYETDIEPWLGPEAAVAVTGVNLVSSGEPSFLIAVATRDPEASDRFLDKAREQEGGVFQEETYQGVTLYIKQVEGEMEQPLTYATFNHFVVFASDDETMKDAIDAWKGKRSLAQDETFIKTQGSLPMERVGFVYLDYSQVIGLAKMVMLSGMAGPSTPGMDQMLEQAEALQAMALSLGFTPSGVRMDMVAVYDPAKLPEEALQAGPSSNKLLDRAPADTILYIPGMNLGTSMQTGLDMVRQSDPSTAEELDNALQMLREQLGLDLEEELFPLLDGEFALVLFPDPQGLMGMPDVPLGMTLITEVSDEGKMTDVLGKLETILAAGGEVEIRQEQVGGRDVTFLYEPTGSPVLGFVVADGFFILSTSTDGMKTALEGGEVLSQAALFKAATAPLPKPNGGYFYFNLQEAIDTLEKTMGPADLEDFTQEVKPFLKPLKAIAAAGEPVSQGQEITTATLFFYIER